jgi:hypothetical protein
MKLTSKLLKKLIKEEVETQKSPEQTVYDALAGAESYSGRQGLDDTEFGDLLMDLFPEQDPKLLKKKFEAAQVVYFDDESYMWKTDSNPSLYQEENQMKINEENQMKITTEMLRKMIQEEMNNVVQEAQGIVEPSEKHMALAQDPVFQKAFQGALEDPNFKAMWEKSLEGGSVQEDDSMPADMVGFGAGTLGTAVLGQLAPAFAATTAGMTAAFSLPIAGALAGMWYLSKKRAKAAKAKEV